MKIVDFHIHSDNSFDGENSIEEMSRKGLEIGLSEICFTEHFSVDPRDISYGVLNYEKYFSETEKAKEKFKGKLKIKRGLEIGEPHLKEYRKDLEKQLEKMKIDFIIGSVHNINGMKLRKYMSNKRKYDVYYDYFNEVYEMIINSDIDIVGHMDLMKRYAYETLGNYTFEDYREIIEKILKAVISRGIGIEINGSGYENKVGEPYPNTDILKLYRELGGEIITIGSDSHCCENLAKHNLKILKLLKEIGFENVFTYNKRKKEVLSISDI
ncbi:histidinol-phosphatase HisJ family protein [Leptotrichia sp. OH3620_COT-345]|uniref:histidinol-phosphatase HisJ family protein n=1 Tax=Leptotrichia sp. OH3620_COT-345 TaxID=2491048 RepID=UPI000F64B46E|nr:histidinol-phosphatase HisJ family protein [Leptotrichia sp. OH3620_COT-345]RRD39868.1 histidinol-phosphatase HisJ family protein [Leptotrichia sp. OH3620_COT-345]